MIIDRSCSSLAQPEHGDGGPVNQNDERYDDGGFSEGTMERPGLKRLLLRAAVMAAHDIGITVLARQRNQCRHRLTKLVRLSWLSPRIVTMIMAGGQPVSMTPTALLNIEMPLRWSEQEAMLLAG